HQAVDRVEIADLGSAAFGDGLREGRIGGRSEGAGGGSEQASNKDGAHHMHILGLRQEGTNQMSRSRAFYCPTEARRIEKRRRTYVNNRHWSENAHPTKKASNQKRRPPKRRPSCLCVEGGGWA